MVTRINEDKKNKAHTAQSCTVRAEWMDFKWPGDGVEVDRAVSQVRCLPGSQETQ